MKGHHAKETLSKIEYKQSDLSSFSGCDFAICHLCTWSATVFRKRHGHFLLDACPSCLSDNHLSLTPIAGNESYKFTMDSKRGLDIEFGLRDRNLE